MSYTVLDFDKHLQTNLEIAGFNHVKPNLDNIIKQVLSDSDFLVSSNNPWQATGILLASLTQKMLENPVDEPHLLRTLILSPTRERASFVRESIKQLLNNIELRYGILVGGSPYPPQIRMLRRAPDILVATPGRMAEHVEANRVNFSGLQTLVLDDLDKALDMGSLSEILLTVDAATSNNCQTIIYASNCNDPDLMTLSKQLLKQQTHIEIIEDCELHEDLQHSVYVVEQDDNKALVLEHLFNDLDPEPIQIICSLAYKNKLQDALDGLGLCYLETDTDHPTGNNLDLFEAEQGADYVVIAGEDLSELEDSPSYARSVFFDLNVDPANYFQRISKHRSPHCQQIISLVTPNEKILRNQIQHMANSYEIEEKFLTQYSVEGHDQYSSPSPESDYHERRNRSSGFIRANTRRNRAQENAQPNKHGNPNNSHYHNNNFTQQPNYQDAQPARLNSHKTPKPRTQKNGHKNNQYKTRGNNPNHGNWSNSGNRNRNQNQNPQYTNYNASYDYQSQQNYFLEPISVNEKSRATIRNNSRSKFTLSEEQRQQLHHDSLNGPRIEGRLTIGKKDGKNSKKK